MVIKKSHRSALNKNGPKIDPWGTPYKIYFHELWVYNLSSLFTVPQITYIKRSALWSDPYANTFAKNKSCGRKSKALESSVRKMPDSSPRSILSRHFFSRVIKQCCAPSPFLKSHWYFDRMVSKNQKFACVNIFQRLLIS